jgi:acetyltransferase
MSALRAAARCKPVLLIKVGKHPAARRRLSHTGALVGADDVFDAALRRAGVVRLANVGQMYAAASALFSHFRPRGNRLAIITNGGGPGVMAADHAADIGIPLAQLDPGTITRLNEPAAGQLVEGQSDRHPRRRRSGALRRRAPGLHRRRPRRWRAGHPDAAGDDRPDPGGAPPVIDIARQSDKPLVTCWMGEEQVSEARKLFKGAGIPTFRTPEPAVDLFSHISNYYRNRQLLMQTPPSISEQAPPRLESARLVIETALMEGRKVLNEMESKAVLAAFRIPIAQTVVARSASEAMVLAEELGLPVVMKIDSPQIVHKTDSGGVRLNLNSLAAVRDAWLEIMDEVKKNRPDAHINGIAIEPMIQKPNGRELVVGMMRDKIFGPTIVFGPGGTSVEAYNSDAPWRCRRSTRFWSPTCWPRRGPPRGSANSATCRRSTWRRSSRAAARLGHGLRTALDQRHGHQPADRRRERRGGGGCAHHHREHADHRRSATTTWRSTPTPRTWRPASRPRTAPRSRSARSSPRTCAWSRNSSRPCRPSRATCAS